MEKCPNKKRAVVDMQSFIFYTHDKRKWLHFTPPLFMHCKVPLFFCSCFYQSIVILSLKIYISYQSSIYKWDLTIDFTFEIQTTKSLLTSHIVVTSDINNRMVQILEFLISTHHNKHYGQIVFLNFLHEMVVSFTHQEFVQGTCYHIWQFTHQVKEHVKRAFEHLVNGVKHYISTRTPFIHDSCVFVNVTK